jgi:hypothetical protein
MIVEQHEGSLSLWALPDHPVFLRNAVSEQFAQSTC